MLQATLHGANVARNRYLKRRESSCTICASEWQSAWLNLGNCHNFYFRIWFEYRMWVWIVWIFEIDWIPNRNLSNKSNLNTDNPKDFRIRPNISLIFNFKIKLKQVNFCITLQQRLKTQNVFKNHFCDRFV